MSDSNEAKALLERTLLAWKKGGDWSAQPKQVPPVYVTEDLWRLGGTLVDYVLEGDGETMGSNIRYRVKLKCTNAAGKTTERSVQYLITTRPALTIMREEG
ncbi:MAG: hypothetical protein ABL921_16820 [Pirellula sp.]